MGQRQSKQDAVATRPLSKAGSDVPENVEQNKQEDPTAHRSICEARLSSICFSKLIIHSGMTSTKEDPPYLYKGGKAPKNVKEVIIDLLVTAIDCKAFEYCTSLASIEIPQSVTTIDYRAFEGCTSLASVEIPQSVTTIDYRAFFGCTSLASIEIPQNVTKIGKDAFFGCTSLASIEIPQSVTTMGESAFQGCTSLASIEIPQSVTIIEKWAFAGCTTLASIEISPSVTTMGESAFQGCTSLASIVIPQSVKTIDKRAFNGCTSLASIEIPQSVTTIGKFAFYGCKSLASIVIPQSVTEITDDAFEGCVLLAKGAAAVSKGVVAWLKTRFDGLPVHTVCHRSEVTKEKIIECLEMHRDSVKSVDSLGISALYVLLMNEKMTLEMVEVLLKAHPDAVKDVGPLGIVNMSLLLKGIDDATQGKMPKRKHHLQDAMATALSLDHWTAPKESLCACDVPDLSVTFLCMDQTTENSESESSTSIPRAARFQEIFLDLIGWKASRKSSSSRFLLDDRFDSILSPDDRKLKDGIYQLIQSSEGNDGRARNSLMMNLEELGLAPSKHFTKQFTKHDDPIWKLPKHDFTKHDDIPWLRYPESCPMPATPSHVFVCNTSVCDLACDAFLCPVAIAGGTIQGRIWHQWQENVLSNNAHLWEELTGGDLRGRIQFDMQKSVAVMKDWPQDCAVPLILLTEVVDLEYHLSPGPEKDEQIHGLLESVRQFLHAAYYFVKDKPPQNHRERHLLALPVVGTGGAGAGDLTGEIVRCLLDVLHDFVSEHNVDCVVVAADEATYAHAQTVREEPISILTSEKQKAAIDLAEFAASGHLSLFLGAGTSMASGLPSWIGLLNEIEDQFMPAGDERRIGKKCGWEPLEMANKLEHFAASRRDQNGLKSSLKKRVADLIIAKKCHPSLVLALLISLPSKSIVTTNYDKLIETAYRNRNVAELKTPKLSILPHHPLPGVKEWLLKMHGCVSHPELIVLSGNDYAQRNVLGGLVQANLLTTHLLFCGLSLSDPNYLKIIREIRASMHPEDSKNS